MTLRQNGGKMAERTLVRSADIDHCSRGWLTAFQAHWPTTSSTQTCCWLFCHSIHLYLHQLIVGKRKQSRMPSTSLLEFHPTPRHKPNLVSICDSQSEAFLVFLYTAVAHCSGYCSDTISVSVPASRLWKYQNTKHPTCMTEGSNKELVQL